MSAVRTIVFPALRLLVWTVIAGALVALAFQGGGTAGTSTGGPGAPTLELTSPPVPVTRGSVVNTVSAQGTVVADPAVPLKATAAGTVRRLLATAARRSRRARRSSGSGSRNSGSRSWALIPRETRP